MDVNKFANYLLVVFVVLLVVGYAIYYSLWPRYGAKGALLAAVMIAVMDVVVMYFVQQYYAKNVDNPKKSLLDDFGNVIGVTVWTSIIAAFLLIVGLFTGYSLANKHNASKGLAVLIPFANTAILVSSVYFVSKVWSK